MLTPILRFVGGVLSVYMVLLFIRILLTWFSGPTTEGRSIQLLHRVTDPYLHWFRRFSFLQAGRVDFSPIAALVTLVVVLNIVNTLAVYGRITVGVILALIVSAIGSAFFFIMGFFLVLTVIRAATVFFGASSINPFWQTIDVIINPILAFIQRTVFRSRQLTYKAGLAWSIAVLLVVFFIGRLLLARLVMLLQSIPI